MASAGQGSPLRSQLALKLKPNTPKKSLPTPSPTVQVKLNYYYSVSIRYLKSYLFIYVLYQLFTFMVHCYLNFRMNATKYFWILHS